MELLRAGGIMSICSSRSEGLGSAVRSIGPLAQVTSIKGDVDKSSYNIVTVTRTGVHSVRDYVARAFTSRERRLLEYVSPRSEEGESS